MSSTLTFKGYVASVEIDFEQGVMHGEVINTRDVLTFSAKNVSDLQSEFEATINDYCEWCETEGAEPEKPYSGVMSLRMPILLHRLAAVRAAQDGVSLNAWLVKTVECELGRRSPELTHDEFEKRMAGVREDVLKVVKQSVTYSSDPLEEPVWSDLRPTSHLRVVQ